MRIGHPPTLDRPAGDPRRGPAAYSGGVTGVDWDHLPDLQEHPSAYYLRLSEDTYQPTLNVQGAWNPHEQHMAPVGGLLAHAVLRHEPRPDLALARISYDILGLMPALPTTVTVRTVRPGRTIELVEATGWVDSRPVVRAQAWRLSRQDTTAVAGGLPDPMPAPADCLAWSPSELWPGGYIRSIELVHGPDKRSGRGQAWLRTPLQIVADEPVSPVAGFLLLVDTANGMNTLVDPRQWAFPNIDMTVHLYRDPDGTPGRWIGFDTLVTVGPAGVGLTSTTLHDEAGPVGRAEQILTVRRLG